MQGHGYPALSRRKSSWDRLDQKSELGPLSQGPLCLSSYGRDTVDNAAATCGVQSSLTAPTEKYNCAVETRCFFTKMK